MQHVSSRGGPRVMLPTADVLRWIDEIADSPVPDDGLYGLACSIQDYCGVIAPWAVPLLIFGDDPADIYCHSDANYILLFRWIGADSLEQLAEFAMAESQRGAWDEEIEFMVFDKNMTLMDACTYNGDPAHRITIELKLGVYRVKSRYAASENVMTIVHRLEFVD